ncbi:MAG: dephospho-CoA kinase, partial [Desulfovibrionaceae bacterium]|nr:dephospho-CoA kinase [Desulfovibrionaceae bacterium]
VWSADAEVSRLYQPGGDGWIMLQNRYGTRFFNEQAGLDRQKLFDAMLAEPALRLEVERLIHPLVQYRLEKFWEDVPSCPSGGGRTGETEGKILAAEVPLFLEAGWEPQKQNSSSLWAELINRHGHSPVIFNSASPRGVPLLVYVDTPAELRYQRLEQRGVSQDKAAALDSWQWPESRKKQGCDLIVDNGGDLERLKESAVALKEIVKDFSLMLQQEKCRKLLQLLDEL